MIKMLYNLKPGHLKSFAGFYPLIVGNHFTDLAKIQPGLILPGHARRKF